MEIFAASHLMPVSAPPIAGGGVAVADGRIVAVAPLANLKSRYDAPVTEFPGCVIMPGLVNAHSHLELTHFSSWKLRKGIDYSPRTYVDWVIQVIKLRRGLSREEREQSLREGLRIALEAGTTAIGEIVSDSSLLPIYLSSPFCGRLYLEIIGQDPVRYAPFLDGIGGAMADFQGKELSLGLSPHAPHTLSQQLLRECAILAGRLGIPTAIHLAESREETAFFHDSTGRIADLLYPFAGWERYLPPPLRTTPTAYLDGAGALGATTAAIHCVHVTPSDAALLRERGCTIVLCARSNSRLDVGKAPVHLFKSSGIPMALGTDSLASNDSLSLWDEMRFVRREFPGLLSPDELLEMATIGGARALGITTDAGTLESGKRGDFLVMKLPAAVPATDLAEALIEEGQLAEIFIRGRRVC